MTTNANALWPDDDNEKLTFITPPAANTAAATPGSVESIKQERAVSLTGWAPEFGALVPMSLADLFRSRMAWRTTSRSEGSALGSHGTPSLLPGWPDSGAACGLSPKLGGCARPSLRGYGKP